MDQEETIEMIESDEDEEQEEEEKEKDQPETPVTEPEKSTVDTKPPTIALPMTEASDAWMDQDETIEMIESDEDEEQEEKEKEKEQPETPKTEPEKLTVETKPSTIALPMTEASDAWMDQEETIEMIESDEDEEQEEEEKEKDQPETPVTEPEKSTVDTKPPTIALPMTEASDAWMDQEETIGMIESDEDEEKPEILERESSSSRVIGSSKKSQSVMDEALRFSCDDETTEKDFEVIKDVPMCENLESTSWAFVASKESSKQVSDPRS